MRKGVVITIILVVVIILAFAVFYVVKSAYSQGTPPPTTRYINVTRENLPAFLQSQQIVRDLPTNGVMSLRFFNFDSGERVWEDSYTITKGKVVKELAQNPDIEITIHSKYIPELGNFCTTIEKAKQNGDMGTELKISQTSFLWKYKGMMSYRSCLGF